MVMHLRQGPPDLKREMPGWLKALDRWMPLAPRSHIAEERTIDGQRVWGYTIGGDGWHDGGRDRKVYDTRLGAVVATWEWWLRGGGG
jgi:hypothetical protein